MQRISGILFSSSDDFSYYVAPGLIGVLVAEESLLAVGRDEELLVAVGVALAEVVAAADALQHGAADALCKDFDCNTVT